MDCFHFAEMSTFRLSLEKCRCHAASPHGYERKHALAIGEETIVANDTTLSATNLIFEFEDKVEFVFHKTSPPRRTLLSNKCLGGGEKVGHSRAPVHLRSRDVTSTKGKRLN